MDHETLTIHYITRELQRYFPETHRVGVLFDTAEEVITADVYDETSTLYKELRCEIGSDDDFYAFHEGAVDDTEVFYTVPLMPEGYEADPNARQRTILNYFREHFPDYNLHSPNGTTDGKSEGETLDEMPFDSECGKDCANAIDAASAFVSHLVMAFGPTVEERTEVIGMCVNVCLCYIRG
jgi:hypothetical protein